MKRNDKPESRPSERPRPVAGPRGPLPWIAVLIGLPLAYAVAAWLLGARPSSAALILQGLVYLVFVVIALCFVLLPRAATRSRDPEAQVDEPEPLATLREPLGDLRELAGDQRRAGAARALGNALSALAPGEGSDLNLVTVDLPALFEDALQDWAACAAARGHELYGFIAPDLAGRAFVDAGRLRTAVDLVLFSGCYASRDGAIEFAAKAGDGEERGPRIDISLDCADAIHAGNTPLAALRRAVHALGGSASTDGRNGLHWRARVPFDVESTETRGEHSRPLADLRVHVAGESPLAPAARAYLEADGACLENDPAQGSVIVLAESSRRGRAEALSQSLKQRYPRTPLLCQAGIGELAGMLMDADGMLSLPVTRDELRRRIRSVLPEPRPRRGVPRALPEERIEPEASQPIGGDAHVLVAEDDMISARVVCRFLEVEGVEVTRVSDGLAALKHLEQGNIRLALLDMHMPKMDGLEVARRQRAHEKSNDGHRVILVALTASAADEDRRACKDAGMDAFLTKPVEREALRKLVKDVEVSKHLPD